MSYWDTLGPAASIVNTELIEPRDYQINIIRSIFSGKNSLVVLPTGLGKTMIAVFAIARAINEGKKALILAPTKPLSEQHSISLKKILKIDPESINLVTGTIGQLKRIEIEEKSKVISATPQTIANDLKAGRISLQDFGVVIFDECHRSVGKYAYTYIANESKIHGIQLLGLTASPGSEKKRVDAIISTLGITNIEMRMSTDPDVSKYVMGKSTKIIYVDKSRELENTLMKLRPLMSEHITNLYKRGLCYTKDYERLPKRVLLEIGKSIGKITASNYKFAVIYDYVYLLNLSHAYDLLSTEGFQPFVDYIESLQGRQEQSRAVRSMLANKSIIDALDDAKKLLLKDVEHPKMQELRNIIKTTMANKSVIVFAQYRSTIKKMQNYFDKVGLDSGVFIGKKDGINIEYQKQVLERFRNGKFKILLATSIGEEGLDIPSVDSVIFYEPVPSEIRNIQRRGRAGRMKVGEVLIFVTRKTKDEAYLLVSYVREKRMYVTLKKIKEEFERKDEKNQGQQKLGG